MNFLPPQSRARRFFFWWVGLILLIVGSGVGAILYTDRQLDRKVDRLEAEVIEQRRVVSEATMKEEEEREFNQKYQSFFTYRDTIDRVESERKAWKEAAEAISSAMPAGAKLFHWQGLGARLDGWALFPSMQEASNFVSKLATEKKDYFSEGWIDCVGDQCTTLDVKKDADKNHVIVRFHFVLQKTSESTPPSQGGEQPSDNPSLPNAGNQGKR
jgi:hypothetical protein